MKTTPHSPPYSHLPLIPRLRAKISEAACASRASHGGSLGAGLTAWGKEEERSAGGGGESRLEEGAGAGGDTCALPAAAPPPPQSLASRGQETLETEQPLPPLRPPFFPRACHTLLLFFQHLSVEHCRESVRGADSPSRGRAVTPSAGAAGRGWGGGRRWRRWEANPNLSSLRSRWLLFTHIIIPTTTTTPISTTEEPEPTAGLGEAAAAAVGASTCP